MAARVFMVLCLLAAVAAPSAQEPPKPFEKGTFEERTITAWKSVHNKILTMAKDFPEDKYSWRPHPDARSVVDEFRHVTIGLEMSTASLKGDKFDYNARVKADDSKPKTRASVVSEMEAAIEASLAVVEKTPKPLLIGWLEHQGEHYGKLVNAYRSNGLVPPISRPKS
jgi:hypothetical protein